MSSYVNGPFHQLWDATMCRETLWKDGVPYWCYKKGGHTAADPRHYDRFKGVAWGDGDTDLADDADRERQGDRV